MRIAMGKGKKRYDKRQSIKKREESRRLNTLKYH
ncbi:MAG: SsrA-binding protein [Candidatus Saccharimonadales bacterium]